MALVLIIRYSFLLFSFLNLGTYHVYSPTMNYPDKLYERMLLFYKVKIFHLKISLFECHIGRLYLTPRDSGF